MFLPYFYGLRSLWMAVYEIFVSLQPLFMAERIDFWIRMGDGRIKWQSFIFYYEKHLIWIWYIYFQSPGWRAASINWKLFLLEFYSFWRPAFSLSCPVQLSLLFLVAGVWFIKPIRYSIFYVWTQLAIFRDLKKWRYFFV